LALELRRAALELPLQVGRLALGRLELDRVLGVDAAALVVELALRGFPCGLQFDLELALRLGGELALQRLLSLGERPLELLGVTLDRLAREAIRQREVVAALRAGDPGGAVDHDGSHAAMVRRWVAQGVSHPEKWGLSPFFRPY